MSDYRKSHHGALQRRVIITISILAVLAALIAVPLITNDDLRYDLAMRFGQIPGRSVERIAEGDQGVLLIVIPLDHGDAEGPNPWLFKAQFLAWPNSEGMEVENLESGARVQVALEAVEFIAANGDGSLILHRGNDVSTGETTALSIKPATMETHRFGDADAVPDSPGDWHTSIWDKQGSWCNRPSSNKRFLACFTRPDLVSYAAGDWQLDVQIWGNYEELYPVFRGQGFLPIVGFAQNDTVIYFQNEHGVWQADVPAEALENAPDGAPFSTPQP